MTLTGPSAIASAEFRFGLEGLGWDAFEVVRFHMREEISRPYEVTVQLARAARLGGVDLNALVNTSATLAIASEERWRLVHGIIADARRVAHTAELIVYDVVLVPSIWRATLRQRCRTFVGETLRGVLVTLLENRARSGDGANGLTELPQDPQAPPDQPPSGSYEAPRWTYRFRVANDARLTNPRLRMYAVQYNESDLNCLSRLLEEEGISYFFETIAGGVVMTLTDRPGGPPLHPRDEHANVPAIGIGAHDRREVVHVFSERAGMAPRTVTMRDFSYYRTRDVIEGRAEARETSGDADHFEFPARDEGDLEDACVTPANVVLERFEVERRLSAGTSSVRTLNPGYRLRIHDVDANESEVTLVSVETDAVRSDMRGLFSFDWPFAGPNAAQGGVAYSNRFEAVPTSVPFRPARRADRPRIFGVQPALVTAEEQSTAPEINADELGRVRVRFPWDQNPRANHPTSHWIRVSQGWAGVAFGAQYVPRVGHEVLVSYLQGDPERPIIVGRVYNQQAPPPYDAARRPTVSTVKSQSSPGGNGFNELRFEDATGSEEIYVHAQRDLNEEVEHDHSMQIDGRQRVRVRRSRSLSVGGSRSSTIGNGDTITVRRGDRVIEVIDGNMMVYCDNGTLMLDTGPGFIEMNEDTIELSSGLGATIRLTGSTVTIEASKIRLSTPQGACVELLDPDVTVAGASVMTIATSAFGARAPSVWINGETETDIRGGIIKLNCE